MLNIDGCKDSNFLLEQYSVPQQIPDIISDQDEEDWEDDEYELFYKTNDSMEERIMNQYDMTDVEILELRGNSELEYNSQITQQICYSLMSDIENLTLEKMQKDFKNIKFI